MLKALLGNDENSPSNFTVSGLPPLELNVGLNGYFDGYIVSAAGMDQMWLTPSFDNKIAITAAAAIAKHRPLGYIRKGALAIVRLQYNNSTMTWTRVVVEKRPDPAHVEVYLVDYGAHQMVNARSLYEMPLELRRFPPQAFPVEPKISAPPDFGPGEWERLVNVRITVRLKAVKDNKFVCDQLTVYGASSRSDIDLGYALRSGMDLERANLSSIAHTTSPQQFMLAQSATVEPERSLIPRHVKDPRDFSVLLVCAFGVVMALVSILMMVGFTYKRLQGDRNRRRHRQPANSEQPGPRNDAIPVAWLEEYPNIPRDQPNSAQVVNTTPAKSSEESREEAKPTMKSKPPSPEEAQEARQKPQENSIIPLEPNAIAVIAAIMGSSSAQLDKQISRTIAIHTGKDNTTADESYENRPRLWGAGSHGLSSILGSSTSPGFITSTPIETAEKTPSIQSSEESSEPSKTGNPKIEEEKATISEVPSSIADEYFESVTAEDIQRMLKERAIIRGQIQPAAMDSSSFSSFVSAVSYQDQENVA
ncbi:hypothetical protein V3C99_016411 [Haemonchus contortus]